MQKSKYIIIVGGILLGLSILNGCYYDPVLPEPISTQGSQTISFSADLIPIFRENCSIVGCHVAGGEHPDLSPDAAYNSLTNSDLLNLTAPESSELYEWLTGKKAQPMPVAGTDPVIASKVLTWIKQGAPNN